VKVIVISEDWGPFQLYPVYTDNVLTAWGALCGRHCDEGSSLSCKAQITMHNEFSEEVAKQKLKLWLLNGSVVDSALTKGRL
jgi:hypothetical protein